MGVELTLQVQRPLEPVRVSGRLVEVQEPGNQEAVVVLRTARGVSPSQTTRPGNARQSGGVAENGATGTDRRGARTSRRSRRLAGFFTRRESEGRGRISAERSSEHLRLLVCGQQPADTQEARVKAQAELIAQRRGVASCAGALLLLLLLPPAPLSGAPYSVLRRNAAALTAACRYVLGSQCSTGNRLPSGLACPLRTRDALASAPIASPECYRTHTHTTEETPASV